MGTRGYVVYRKQSFVGMLARKFGTRRPNKVWVKRGRCNEEEAVMRGFVCGRGLGVGETKTLSIQNIYLVARYADFSL